MYLKPTFISGWLHGLYQKGQVGGGGGDAKCGHVLSIYFRTRVRRASIYALKCGDYSGSGGV